MKAFASLVGLAFACLAACIATPSALAGPECPSELTCTTVTGPWAQVTGSQYYSGMGGGNYSNPTATGSPYYESSRWSLSCNELNVQPLGVSANGAGSPNYWSFQLAPFETGQSAFTGLLSVYPSVTVYAALIDAPTAGPYAWQAVIGCPVSTKSMRATASPLAPVALPKHRLTLRSREIRVRAGSRMTVRYGCQAGERLEHGAASLGWYTKKPPSRSEMRELSEVHWIENGKLNVRVTSGKHAGDDELVKVQLHADCRR